jgi:hypothetical protein
MTIHFIKKIWFGEIDAKVHAQFVRFSRGIFENRAILNIKQGNKIKANSTFELANDFVLFLANLEKTFAVSGILLSRENPKQLFDELEIEAAISKKKNLFEAKIDTGLTSEQLKRIAEITYFMLFDMHSQDISFKVKKKLPQPSRSGQEKINDKFCTLELDLKFFSRFHEEFLFDLPENFNKARITHRYEISEIILPRGEKNFEQIRLKAVRKGRIVRKIEVDGKEKITAKDFKA